MRGWITERGVRAMENQVGMRLEYLRDLARTAPGVLPRIVGFLPLSIYRAHVPVVPMHVARIAATVTVDCGECVQIAVNVARDEGVPRPKLEAAVRGDRDALDDGEAAALAFAEVLAGGLDATVEREAVRTHFGDRGVAELSAAVASTLFFPVLKQGMGYGNACHVDAVHYASA